MSLGLAHNVPPVEAREPLPTSRLAVCLAHQREACQVSFTERSIKYRKLVVYSGIKQGALGSLAALVNQLLQLEAAATLHLAIISAVAS